MYRKQNNTSQTFLNYYSDKRCVICDNPDFYRVDKETNKIVQDHKLTHLNLGFKIIVFCNSCKYAVKEALK